MEKQIFVYSYSSEKNREVERIRSKYLPKEENKVDTLKKLDCKVRSAGQIEGLCIGVIGCLVFGIGMCFGLDAIPGADWLSIVFCIIGALIMIPAYPIYRCVSDKTKKKLTPEILRLSDEILKR